MTEKADEVLSCFYDVLKDDGLLILTIDYPFLHPEHFQMKASLAGFEFVGAVDYEIDEENAIKGQYHGLKCYSALLRKNAGYTTKIEIPSETK
jgi:hypothetical protein